MCSMLIIHVFLYPMLISEIKFFLSSFSLAEFDFEYSLSNVTFGK